MPEEAKEPIGGGAEGGSPPCCCWSEAEKRRIVAESYQPGVSVSVVARRHDQKTNRLFTWRRRFRELAGDTGNGGFVPVVVEARRATGRARRPRHDLSWQLAIRQASGARPVPVAGDVGRCGVDRRGAAGIPAREDLSGRSFPMKPGPHLSVLLLTFRLIRPVAMAEIGAAIDVPDL